MKVICLFVCLFKKQREEHQVHILEEKLQHAARRIKRSVIVQNTQLFYEELKLYIWTVTHSYP
jgi:hypothetical protein